MPWLVHQDAKNFFRVAVRSDGSWDTRTERLVPHSKGQVLSRLLESLFKNGVSPTAEIPIHEMLCEGHWYISLMYPDLPEKAPSTERSRHA